MVFGMLDRQNFFAIPFIKLEEFKLRMNTTNIENKDVYWHIKFAVSNNDIFLKLNDGTEIDLKEFTI